MLVMFCGLAAMYFVRSAVGVILAGSVMMSGYMLMTAVLSANIRDWTPVDKAGHFQGIRMIFAVLLPMAYTFIKAQGCAIGTSLLEEDKLDYAREMIAKAAEKNVKLLLPVDTAVGDEFKADCRKKIVDIRAMSPSSSTAAWKRRSPARSAVWCRRPRNSPPTTSSPK